MTNLSTIPCSTTIRRSIQLVAIMTYASAKKRFLKIKERENIDVKRAKSTQIREVSFGGSQGCKLVLIKKNI